MGREGGDGSRGTKTRGLESRGPGQDEEGPTPLFSPAETQLYHQRAPGLTPKL